MGITTRHILMDRSDISHSAFTITIFPGVANRQPTVSLAKFCAMPTTDWLERGRFINTADRIRCQKELLGNSRPDSSARRCFRRDMIDAGRWGNQLYVDQNGR